MIDKGCIMEASTDNKTSPAKWGCGGCLVLLVAFIGFAWTMLHFTPWNRFPEGALEALRQDPGAIFYSLEPGSGDKPEGFQGYEIVGQITLNDASDRNEIVERLAAATIGAWDAGAACFDPRHGFRAHGPGGTTDFLLCFECGKAVVYFPDGSSEWIGMTGKGDFFNDYLKGHNVALPSH
jgi:hypothetical protein